MMSGDYRTECEAEDNALLQSAPNGFLPKTFRTVSAPDQYGNVSSSGEHFVKGFDTVTIGQRQRSRPWCA
jgi:hypothetical protein